MVEWDVKVMSRSFSLLKWDVSALELDKRPTEWKEFFRTAVNLTMPSSLLKGQYTRTSDVVYNRGV